MWYDYIMKYYSAALKNDIMKFASKLIRLGKNHPKGDNPDPERQILYVFTYK